MVTLEKVEDEAFITINHEMTKNSYIKFIAAAIADEVTPNLPGIDENVFVSTYMLPFRCTRLESDVPDITRIAPDLPRIFK